MIASVGQNDTLSIMANPYADPELQKVLTRKYQIANIPWSDADTFGTELATVDPMASLLAIQNIADKLTQFRWLRADVAIEVRVNATPFHIGSIMVSYIPRTTNESSDPISLWPSKNVSLTQKSQNHGMVLSASSMNNVTIAMQREAPIVFDPIDELGAFDGCLGTLDFTVLNPLVLASGGSASPLNISVFASFANPKVAGYGYFPLLNPPRPRVVPHSLDVAAEALQRAAGSILGPEASSLFKPTIASGAIDSFKSLIESVAPVAQFAMSMGLSKPPNETTVVPIVNDDFRDYNYAHGVAQATKASLHPGAGLGSADMSFLKKNKIKDFIMKPAYITTRVLTKTDAVDTPLLKIPIHPSLSSYENGVFSPTPLAYACNSFVYYRGGMKLMFEFITSQFVTARVRITHWPGPVLPSSIEEYAGDAVSAIVDIRGDTDFPFTVPYISPLPYQKCRGYLHSDNSAGYQKLPIQEQNSFVTLSLINGVQQPDFDGVGVIYVNVYVSAADDFVFGGAVLPQIRDPLAVQVAPSISKVVPHSLEVKFGKSFKPMIPASVAYEAGMVLPEQYSGLEEVCMRYYPVIQVSGAVDIADVQPLISQYDLRTLTVNNGDDALTYWARCFRWNRGALRYKLVVIPAADPVDRFTTSVLFASDPINGTSFAHAFPVDHNLRSAIEFEIPWVLNSFMNSFWDAIPQDRLVNTSPYEFQLTPGVVPTLLNVNRAAGDDFVFGHQLAVPTYPYTLPPPSPYVEFVQQTPPASKKLDSEVARLDQSLAFPEEIKERLRAYLSQKEKGGHSSRQPTSSQ